MPTTVSDQVFTQKRVIQCEQFTDEIELEVNSLDDDDDHLILDRETYETIV